MPQERYLKTVAIRQAGRGDAARLHELHTSAVRALSALQYSPEIIDGWLQNRSPAGYLSPIERGALFVAEAGARIVGFGEAAPGAVVAIYVDPSEGSRGVGRAILAHAVEMARRDHDGPIRVEATLNASGFYEKYGFREIRRTTVRRNQVDVPVVVMEMPAEARFVLRPAEDRDREFCFRVTREAMRSYVEATFGPWNDGPQREYFESSFASIPHEIVVAGGRDVGVWSVVREPDRITLKKMYLLPDFQRKGLGSALLGRLIRESEAPRLPIELRYLRVNPVASLYERFGFRRLREEAPYVYMRRMP